MFTAPRAGVYLITFSTQARYDVGEQTWVNLYKNGACLEKIRHDTYYGDDGYPFGQLGSTGGRTVYLRLEAGDTLTLQTEIVTGQMFNI